ncbi:helix-turn-helix domain-containing protein [Desulfobacula sp.]|uniref:helix-turn-helix domain-containing protein n=1 Tax=Desulfobacula sp. TaxID=2593537 RepID=UPI001EC052DB|nr:helix-turn-helix transcriptional regulator [Desulfobacula sp.]
MDINILRRQLGLRFKELRLSKGLKQEDLENWGFSYRYYGKIERGLVNLTLKTLARLCEIFEVSFYDLFAFMDDGEFQSEDREAVAVKVANVLKRSDELRIKKLKMFLDDIL